MTKLKSKMKEHICLNGLKKKEGEDYTYTALAATTHPDRVGDILSVNAITQIVDCMNDDSKAGDTSGSFRSVSLYHDWIHEKDPTLDEVAYIKGGTARMVDLEDGHKGAEVEIELNKFYRGDMPIEEVKSRIEQGGIAGLSIEYDTDSEKTVEYNGEEYRFIDSFTEFGGVGLARARMIANPHAVIYKEIEDKVMKDSANLTKEVSDKMAKEAKIKEEEPTLDAEPEAESVDEPEEDVETEAEPEQESVKEQPVHVEAKEKTLSVKEIIESKEMQEVLSKLQPDKKTMKMKEVQESGTMLHVKEMNEAVGKISQVKEFDAAGQGKFVNKMDILSFKEAARQIYSQPEYDQSLKEAMMSHGIPLLPTTWQIKSDGTKLRIVGKMQTKDTLDTASNTTTYTQSPVEFSDLYIPGLIDTFNNRTDLFDALPKRDHIMGTPYFQWRVSASRRTGLDVDVDDPTVTKSFMDKVKLQTPIKEYRNGISVTDFMLTHSRASIGDLFMIEAEKAMIDLRKELNKDLYLENADGDSTALLGLEAVADSTGNTTLYGLTRSTANRLQTSALANTYTNNATVALTTAQVRAAYRYPWEDGAEFGNLRIVCSPAIREALFELLDGQQRLFTQADFGFSGAIRFDGIPVIVDSDCPSTASQRQLYVLDFDSDMIVFSRPPQLIGLAKVSAATEAYVMTNLAHVYLRPRRIHMIDNIA